MKDRVITGILLFAGCFAGYLYGHVAGAYHGAAQLHRGVFSCQTLPDSTVYCWTVKP